MVDYLRKQFQSIDIAKFICAVLIIIMHTGIMGSINIYIDYYFLNTVCRIAVPFFFICNGFFIFKNIDIDHFEFSAIKKPLLKLVKLYFLWSAIYFPYYLFVISRRDSFNFSSFVISFFLELIWYGAYPIFWYVLATIYGVLIISFLLRIKVKPQVIFFLSIPLYVFGLFNMVYGVFITNENVAVFMSISNNIFGGTLNAWFNGFAFMSLGLCIWYYKPQINKIILIVLLSMFVILFLFEHVFISIQGYGGTLTTSISLLFLIPTLFLSLLRKNPNFDTSNIRNISVLLYFVHTAFNLIVYQFIKRIGLLDTILWSPVRFIIVFCLSFGFSYLITWSKKRKNYGGPLFGSR